MRIALFGRDVCDAETSTVVAPDLAGHGYQLWTAAIGTLIEAGNYDATLAILVVHQFVPTPASPVQTGDRRNWPAALADNDAALTTFIAALGGFGAARSHPTAFVCGGIELRVAKAQATLGVACRRASLERCRDG